MLILRFPVVGMVKKIRVKTPARQRPRGSESRRCGACGHRISAGDKFCMGCGMPAAGTAPAAAPQKQRPKTRAKPAVPRTGKRKPKTVPVAVPREKSETAPAQKQSSKNVPETVYCVGCAQPFPHGRYIKCPNCGRFWVACLHRKERPRWLRRVRAKGIHDASKCANIDTTDPDYAYYFDWLRAAKRVYGWVDDQAMVDTDVRKARKWASIYAKYRVEDGLPPQRRA